MSRLSWPPARRPSLGTALVIVAVVPIVVATVRTLRRGWIAAGDNGLILLRSQDVATSDHPLLGTWTSASVAAGRTISNPGPLWFDWLAPFVRVAGSSVGFAVAVMVSNIGAVVLAAWAARRAGGETAMVLVTALSTGLAWSMGSELLFDAWQPHAMILPFWAFLVVLWAVVCGHVWFVPWAIGLASLFVQTHLSYTYLVAMLGAVAVAAGAVVVRRDARRGVPRDLRGPLVASIGVASLAWIQPLLDQVFGEGNLGALLDSSGGDSDRIGLRFGARLVGSVVALPPWWTRAGFSTTIRPTGVFVEDGALDVAEGRVADLPAAVVGLVLVVGLLVAVSVWGWRRRDRSTVALAALALAAVVACLASMVLSPVGSIGLSPHQMRWLWPVSALVLLAPLHAIGRWQPVRRSVVAGGAIVTCVVSILALPTHAAPEGPTADRRYGPPIEALVDQLDDYRPGQRVLFDFSEMRFGEPYSGPVLAALGRHGVDVAVTDEAMVRQVGGRRRADGSERVRLTMLEGDAAISPPAGARRIAFVEGVTPAERAELDRLRAEVVAATTRSGVVLNHRGLDAVAAGRIAFPATVLEPGDDATALEEAGWLAVFVRDGFVDLDPALDGDFQRYAELAEREARFTVGLFEVPIDGLIPTSGRAESRFRALLLDPWVGRPSSSSETSSR